jgi:release factor glutamine methyltransferase
MAAAVAGGAGVMATAIAQLEQAGCDTPRLDAELLLADALGWDRAQLFTRDYEVPPGFAERLRRRAAREPVAYITGRRAFRRIELAVDPRVLIPRPETETLVEAALGLPVGARVHDVGTGSGAVALALKEERPDLAVSGSDASPDAVDVARANAQRLGLDVAFEVARGLPAGQFDLVVANLPYVREDEWDGLAPEIRLYEPREALVSGADGLDAIRELVAAAPSGTRAALEHAPGQAAAVRALLRDPATVEDLSGRERVTTGAVG